MIRTAFLLLAVALAACSSSAPSVGARLRTPSAIVAFRGVTERHPGVEPYLAVAGSGNDQLSLLDPRDDRAVVSPGLVFPLAVPTAANPMFLASASLGDGGGDVLVVAGAPDPSTGEVKLQLVSTWDGRPRAVPPAEGGDANGLTVGTGGEAILSLVGVPVPQDAAPVDGVVPPLAGAARLIVSLSGGRLAVIRAERLADGGIQLREEGSVALGGATPFDALSLVASPDGRHVYAASPDVVTGSDGRAVEGVAELDTLGDPATWTVRALSARATTYGVAAARVVERSIVDADIFDRAQLTNGPRLLVYALPDRSTCGPLRAVDCGIVTIDPVTGDLAEDPMGEMPYRAPMRLPVVPIQLVAWDRAPEVADPADMIEAPLEEPLPLIQVPGLRYSPGTGRRATSALGLATGADGRTYSLDLGRFGPGSDTSLLRPPSQTRVLGLLHVTDPSVAAQIGMWNHADPPALETDAATMMAQMLVTPGYTPDEGWVLGWQYPLPGLQGRRSVLVRDPSLGLVLAMQTASDGGTTPWREAVGLYSPLLGVHVGDVVEVGVEPTAELSDTCEAIGEGRVAQILPPDPARWPGGAVVLSPPVDPPTRPDVPRREDVYACWTGQLPEGVHPATATISSGEWVLIGESFGHAGRPQPDVLFSVDYPGRDAEGFVETRLEQSCALPSWPPPDPVPACDADCRSACEQLALARRTRRFYYPQDDCQEAGGNGELLCAVTGRPATFPESILVGPALEFRFGLNPASVTPEHPIVRAAHVQFRTASGLSQSFRAPTVAGQATGAIGFDRSPFTKKEPRIVFYVSYRGDVVYEAAYGAFATESKTIR